MLLLVVFRQEFGEKLSASKKISESSSSLNTTNQCTQINPQDLIGHNCDPISQESFSEPEKASTNNDLSPRIIVYPEKSIQTVACSIRKCTRVNHAIKHRWPFLIITTIV